MQYDFIGLEEAVITGTINSVLTIKGQVKKENYSLKILFDNKEVEYEDLYKEETVKGGDPVDEPEDHPEHTGYDFDYWCTTDFVEYNFNLPVNSDLKLINCTNLTMK